MTINGNKIGSLNPLYSPRFVKGVSHNQRMGFGLLGDLYRNLYDDNEVVSNIGQLRGVVVMINYQLDRPAISPYNVGIYSNNEETLINVNVRIPEIHGFMPDPLEIENEEERINLAKTYPVFMGHQKGTQMPLIGDIVLVSFFNNEEKSSGGVYHELLSSIGSVDESTLSPSQLWAKKKSLDILGLQSSNNNIGELGMDEAVINYDISDSPYEGNNPVIRAAESEWARIVMEPPGTNWMRIRDYWTAGLTWTEKKYANYSKNGDGEWCGAFAAFCYSRVGLKKTIRNNDLSSTYRLYRWSNNNARRIHPKDLQEGDIAVVRTSRGGQGKYHYGNHIVLVRNMLGTHIETTEGNAFGKGPNGKSYEGVVHKTWAINPKYTNINLNKKTIANVRAGTVLYGVRPLKEDYE